MIAAQFEAFCSRPIAPTRRLALGDADLPVLPAAYGPALVGLVVATFVPTLGDELADQLDGLVDDLEAGRRVPQPRVRHRLQDDRVGLQRCWHGLVRRSGRLSLSISGQASPAHHALAAVYVAAGMPEEARTAGFAAIRLGAAWRGPLDGRLLARLFDLDRVGDRDDPVAWARRELHLDGVVATRGQVQRAFRSRLIEVHPDRGGASHTAADRIDRLARARAILLDLAPADVAS